MSHTPGPWALEVGEQYPLRVLCAAGYPVAQGLGHSGDYDRRNREASENARLIAAAPDLLEALRYFADLQHCGNDSANCESASGPSCGRHGDTDVHADEIAKAKAAIAKAEGR
jgi:hypothetical protein